MKIFLLFLSLFLANCSKDWSYKSNKGSQNWGDIKPGFKFCKVGYNQSPIDISSEMFQESNDNIVTTNYGNSEFEKIRQGDTVDGKRKHPTSNCSSGWK